MGREPWVMRRSRSAKSSIDPLRSANRTFTCLALAFQGRLRRKDFLRQDVPLAGDSAQGRLAG
jgi:hypothetical protein